MSLKIRGKEIWALEMVLILEASIMRPDLCFSKSIPSPRGSLRDGLCDFVATVAELPDPNRLPQFKSML